MDITLLGTGSADGWPNPFCSCASCNDARSNGHLRGQTSALVDGRLLIDCGPEIPRAAERHGHSLADVEVLLFTHAHADHVGPAALLFREWAKAAAPLTVAGPPAALALCEQWAVPRSKTTFVSLLPGDRTTAAGYSITAVEANHHGDDIGPALIYDVESADGSRLLYATDTGQLSPGSLRALTDRRFDVALIEETFGDHTEHEGAHLDLVSFPQTMRELQGVGALTTDSQVVAVHLSHHNPPTSRLRQIMQEWGADVVADGTVLRTGRSTPAPARRLAHRTLVLGGARSGKSAYAEQLLAAEAQVTYVATARSDPDDAEWQERIAHHRERRLAHWTTVETIDVVDILISAEPGDVLLIDCLTLWLTQVLSDTGGWDGDFTGVAKQVEALVEAWRTTQARVVAVSNEVGWGVVPASESGRAFRDWQGRLNAAITRASDQVTLMVAGHPLDLTQ